MAFVDTLRQRLAQQALAAPDMEAKAAVAMILRKSGDDEEILLIRRQDRPEDPWSGHMAFPGGRHQSEDPSLVETAVRETREEVGMDLARSALLLGPMPGVAAMARGKPAGLVVTPHVFELTRHSELVLEVKEVREAVWASVGALTSGKCDTTFIYPHGDTRHELPAYDVGGRIVWGLTYHMLQSLFRLAREGDDHGTR